MMAEQDDAERAAATRRELAKARNRAVQASRRLDLAARAGASIEQVRALDVQRLERKQVVAELEKRIREMEI